MTVLFHFFEFLIRVDVVFKQSSVVIYY